MGPIHHAAVDLLGHVGGGKDRRLWYSTFAASEGTAWRVVEVEKVVTKACSDASLYGAIEAWDSVKCFDACGAPRNTSSPCWIGCFTHNTGRGGHAAHRRRAPGRHVVRCARRRVGGALRVQRPFSGRLPGGCRERDASMASGAVGGRATTPSESLIVYKTRYKQQDVLSTPRPPG